MKINTAKLADEVAANVLIQGSAWRSEKNALSLANNRALAVRNIYVERGITSSRLSIAGNVVEDATADENEARHVDTIMLIPGKATPGGEKSTKDQPRKDRGTPALSTEETLLVRKVSGIGPKSTDVLNKAGITKVIEVARMEPKELAGILDISDNQAVKLITNAKSLLRG